jgi:type IV pilus assembly protein PilF
MMARAHASRRLTQRVLLLAVLSLALVAIGCAGPGRSTDLRTASDQSEADRLAQVRLELAAGYFSLGQASTALDEVKRVLAIQPDSAPALNLRGLIYGQLGEAALAEESFRRALKLAPRDPEPMHNYAWFLCQQGRWQEADAWFGTAIDRTTPADAARGWRARGVCLGNAQRLEAAVGALVRADELEPAHPVTTYHLASTWLALGQAERARAILEPVLQRAATPSESDLWLAVRLAHRLGDDQGRQRWADLLRSRYPGSASANRLERGMYGD